MQANNANANYEGFVDDPVQFMDLPDQCADELLGLMAATVAPYEHLRPNIRYIIINKMRRARCDIFHRYSALRKQQFPMPSAAVRRTTITRYIKKYGHRLLELIVQELDSFPDLRNDPAGDADKVVSVAFQFLNVVKRVYAIINHERPELDDSPQFNIASSMLSIMKAMRESNGRCVVEARYLF